MPETYDLMPEEQNPYQTQSPYETSLQGEMPEWLKAARANATARYDPYSNTLYRTVGANIPMGWTPTSVATGTSPWMTDIGYQQLAPQVQQEFATKIQELESMRPTGAPATLRREWDPYEPGSTAILSGWQELWEQYPELTPTTYQRARSGELTGYQSLMASMGLRPGQYKKTTDQTGAEVYHYIDPVSTRMLTSPTPPPGMVDVDRLDLYGLMEQQPLVGYNLPWDLSTTGGMIKPEEAYKGSEQFQTMSQEDRTGFQGLLSQIQGLRGQAAELQGLRPGERTPEIQTSLSNMLQNLQNLQSQVSEKYPTMAGWYQPYGKYGQPTATGRMQEALVPILGDYGVTPGGPMPSAELSRMQQEAARPTAPYQPQPQAPGAEIWNPFMHTSQPTEQQANEYLVNLLMPSLLQQILQQQYQSPWGAYRGY